jgi:hypothetical protein
MLPVYADKMLQYQSLEPNKNNVKPLRLTKNKNKICELLEKDTDKKNEIFNVKVDLRGIIIILNLGLKTNHLYGNFINDKEEEYNNNNDQATELFFL